MLKYENGDPFASGSADYTYAPDDSPRLNLEVEVEGNIRLHAVVDTGAPYFILNPKFASQLDLSEREQVGRIKLSTRKGSTDGKIYRLTLTLIATVGNSLQIEATTFVPADDRWDDEPSFLGLANCLDRLRFAVDPISQIFFFGKA